jgi:hypothetical protein
VIRKHQVPIASIRTQYKLNVCHSKRMRPAKARKRKHTEAISPARLPTLSRSQGRDPILRIKQNRRIPVKMGFSFETYVP